MPSMQERYITELRDRDPSSVDVLFLDNSEGGQIAGLGDNLTSLVSLSLVNCGLTSVKGLPVLPALQHLDLTNNSLGEDAGLEIIVKNAPELERLILPGNKFTSLEVFRPLKMLNNLVELDISTNEALGLTESYRDKIFEMLPSLKVLDGCDSQGEEVEEEFAGEGAEDSGDESGEEEEGPGLSYLDKSKFSDDETDDYQPKEDDEEAEDGTGESGDEPRGTKRSAEENGDEPEAKKAAEE